MATKKRDFKDFRAFPGEIIDGIYVFPPLYSADKAGRTRFWKQFIKLVNPEDVRDSYEHDWVEDFHIKTIKESYYDSAAEIPYFAMIYNEQGIVDGKLSKHPPMIIKEGSVGLKNKANARNVFTQALINARSLYQKKIDSGYVTNMKALSKPDRLWMAMAAHPYDKHKKKLIFPCYSQPKLDGVRCIMYRSGDRIVKYSRNGNFYNGYDEWDKYLMPVFEVHHNLHLDGELYLHGKHLQEITGVARNDHKKFNLEYHVFDLFNTDDLNLTFEDRIDYMDEVFDIINAHEDVPSIVRVQTTKVKNMHDLDKIYNEYLEQGFEGQMLRNADGLYETSRDREMRSYNLLKRKALFADEFQLVGVKRAENGRAAGTFVGVFINSKGVKFRASPKNMTMNEMKELYDVVSNDKSYIGRYATIEYEDLSNDDVPLRPKFVAFRFDK